MSDDYDDEEVGYKKPPKKTQFKKGQSGNPKGRPPKPNLYDAVIQALNEDIEFMLNGEKTKMTAKEAILKKVMIDALNGTGSTNAGM